MALAAFAPGCRNTREADVALVRQAEAALVKDMATKGAAARFPVSSGFLRVAREN